MRRRGHFLILGAVAATTVAAVRALSGGADGAIAGASHDAPPSSRAAEAPDTALRAQLDTMRGTMLQLERAHASLQRDVDRSAADRAAADAARQAADDAARIEAEDPTAPDREATAMATRCDAKVASEPVDKEWSREKNTQFVAFFARAPLAGTRVRAVDCRTTMCRIQLAHASVGDRGRFIQSFSDLAGPTGMVFAHIETEDDLDVEVYVTRDGVGLP